MRHSTAAICVLLLGACAAGKSGVGDIDANTSTIEDAPDVVVPDAMPKNDFGEACTGNAQCESGLCILVGTHGQCTQTCGDCPTGYGCLGVTGIQVEGQVTFVCVPTSTQLCTTCTQDSECTLIGMDKCVTYPDGDKACGQDCSTVSCPTGFVCDPTSKQCMAASNACDCTAANPGAMQPCNITTPWNVCLGSQTCAGATGWGTCAPPSTTDNPDDTFTDDNCDGIDGDRAKAIFVAGGGADTSTCGLTYMTPCQTISHGILRAATEARPHVYVQAGTYTEAVALVNGVSVYGGYDFNWQRGAYSDAAHRVIIAGAQDTGAGGDGEWLAIRAHNVITPVTVADVVIKGPNASGTGGSSTRDGKSSYAVHAVGSKLTLTRVQILAGNGAGGANGAAGNDAATVDRQSFMNGATGGNGDQFATLCNNSDKGSGGAAGTNTCTDPTSSRAVNGGRGGDGGTMDTSCAVFSPNLNARSGSNGAAAVFTSGAFGAAGSGGSGGGTCGPTTSGNPGLAVNGAAGGGANGAYVASTYWYARAGGNGATGENGSGGGGGGGGGGCDSNTDAYGAGGAGGGAGGCAARGGGLGGGGGGGSFGIFATGTSTITIANCDLVRGTAGNGGGGGAGGRGQSGGLGGGIALHPGSAQPGAGGSGAHGGHGGGGGGGAGGSSIGIASTSDTTITGTCTISGGSPGNGGGGGPSAPAAPQSDRDGNAGTGGSPGTLVPTRVCTSTASC